jgi:pimeloyl-ACP methyl ester carboxylesterase
MLEQLDLTDVTVIGNSFGGWLAAEIALQDSPRVSGVVIIDGIGIEVPGHPMTDVSGLSPAEIRAYSWHDPSNAPPAPGTGGTGPSPDVQALIGYTGPVMSDPALAGRLGGIASRFTCCGAKATGSSTPSMERPTPPRSRCRRSRCCPAPAICRRSRRPRNCWARCSTSATGDIRAR